MTLIGRSGSFAETSPHNLDPNETKLIEPNGIAVGDKHASELAHIVDTFTNRTSINPERFIETYGILLGFPEGTPITVTYFHNNNPNISIKTITDSISFTENSIHIDMTQIRGFEFRVLGALNSQYNEDDGTMIIDGEGVTYPGFVPYIGDLFFFSLDDGKIALFKITNVTRMTYRQGTYHKIAFDVFGYLTKNILDKINSYIKNIVFFDKKRFLTGDTTFLTHDSYIHLTELTKKKKELLQYYFNRFFDETYNTLMRPDEIYDPYVVEFLMKRISIKDTKRRPLQLYSRLKDYYKSIWYIFSESETKDISNIEQKFYSLYHTATAFDTDQNALINRQYIKLGETPYPESTILESGYYVFTSEFYNNGSTLTPIEFIIRDYLNGQILDPQRILDHIGTYKFLDEQAAFYNIPIYIFLIDTVLNDIK